MYRKPVGKAERYMQREHLSRIVQERTPLDNFTLTCFTVLKS